MYILKKKRVYTSVYIKKKKLLARNRNADDVNSCEIIRYNRCSREKNMITIYTVRSFYWGKKKKNEKKNLKNFSFEFYALRVDGYIGEKKIFTRARVSRVHPSAVRRFFFTFARVKQPQPIIITSRTIPPSTAILYEKRM